MAKLIEITPEQYDCLRELGVPVWWWLDRARPSDQEKADAIARMGSGDSRRWPSCDVLDAAPTAAFYTIMDSENDYA